MIDINNYESYLYLYQEGELDASKRREVEAFLAAHPDIKAEMEQYYDPTLVVTAETPASKRAVPFWRWAAAACLLLAIGSLAWRLSQRNSTADSTTPIMAEAKVDTSSTLSEDTIEPTIIESKDPTTARTVARVTRKSYRQRPSQAVCRPVNEAAATSQPVAETAVETPAEGAPAEPLPPCPIPQYNNQIVLADEVIYVDFLADESKSLPDPIVKPQFSLYEALSKTIQHSRARRIRFIKEELLAMNETN